MAMPLRGKFHMDVAWDAVTCGEFGEHSYAYFALNDEEIANDHAWDKTTTPACSHNDLSYFLRNGLYVNDASQLKEAVKALAKKQAKVFRLKLSRNVPLPNDAGKHLARLVLDEAARFAPRVQLSSEWNESARCFFAKIVG